MLVAAEVPDVVLWAPVASAVLLLGAGIASWRTATTTARSYRRSISPALDPVFLLPRGGGPVQLVVRNLGGGAAKAPIVMIEIEGIGAWAEYIGDGHLAPGDGHRITTTVDAATLGDRTCRAVIGCRDVDNLFQAWSTDWEHKVFRDWRRRPVRTIDWRGAFQAFYPGRDPVAGPRLSARIDRFDQG